MRMLNALSLSVLVILTGFNAEALTVSHDYPFANGLITLSKPAGSSGDPYQTTSGNLNIAVDPFDPALGSLNSVSVNLTAGLASYSFEVIGNISGNIGNYSVSILVNDPLDATTLTEVDFNDSLTAKTHIPPPPSATNTVAPSGVGNPGSITLTGADVDAFTGTGTLSLPIHIDARIYWNWLGAPKTITAKCNPGGVVTVTYDYSELVQDQDPPPTSAVPVPASLWGGLALMAAGLVGRSLRRRAA